MLYLEVSCLQSLAGNNTTLLADSHKDTMYDFVLPLIITGYILGQDRCFSDHHIHTCSIDALRIILFCSWFSKTFALMSDNYIFIHTGIHYVLHV